MFTEDANETFNLLHNKSGLDTVASNKWKVTNGEILWSRLNATILCY